MKVGTDGVLLGAWVTIDPSARRMLDIGTGTGVIALMLAQRAPEAQITGIDIGEVTQARENGAASPWGDRLTFEQCAVQQFAALTPYDLIVSNPPFYDATLPSPDAGRTLARHTVSLSFEALCAAAERLLAPEGRFAVVIPCSEAGRLLRAAGGRLAPIRRTEVRTTPRHAAKRTLLELAHTSSHLAARGPMTVDTLTVGTGVHEEYTEAYRQLTGDFYLKF